MSRIRIMIMILISKDLASVFEAAFRKEIATKNLKLIPSVSLKTPVDVSDVSLGWLLYDGYLGMRASARVLVQHTPDVGVELSKYVDLAALDIPATLTSECQKYNVAAPKIDGKVIGVSIIYESA